MNERLSFPQALNVAPPAKGLRPRLRKGLEYGLAALLIFSPLPAASVSEWSIFVIQMAVGILAAAYVLLEPKPAVNPQLALVLRRVRIPTAGLFGFLALQIVPLPAGLVRLLSPGTYALHKLYDPAAAHTAFLTLSVAPGQTFREALEILTYFLLAYLVIRTVTHGRQIRAVIVTLVGMGVFEALYGLYELKAAHPRILFYPKVFSPNSVTGTFVNQSHLSGYLEMIVPLALGLVIARMNLFSFGTKGLREKFLLWTSQGVVTNLLLAAAVVVMALGIVNSHSRAGLIVLFFSFFLVFGLGVLAYSRAGFRQPWIRNFIRVTFLVVLVMALYAGIGSTIQRFSLDNLIHEDRPLYWANAASMIGDFPFFGTGLGTFVSAYPAYEKRGGQDMLLVHAHNDYLEYLVELGVVGAVLFFGIIIYLSVQAFLAWRARRNPEAKGLALGGIVALAGMGLHTITDFNLHIPANMLLFTVVLSLTLVSAFYRKT